MMTLQPKTPRFGMGRVYLDANSEALRRGDRRVGTEHVLLALLKNPDSVTARALEVDLDTARAALLALDRHALHTVGIGADVTGPVFPGREGEGLRLTPAARVVFTGSGKEKAKGERIGIQHVLLSLLSRQPPDPVADLLGVLGVDRADVRARLRAFS